MADRRSIGFNPRGTTGPLRTGRGLRGLGSTDGFTANELLTYEAIGPCNEGEAEKFIKAGDNTYGGKYVTNPSGGPLSKGHLAAPRRSARSRTPRSPAQPRPRGACVMTMYGAD